jgi:hypothetical protein
MSEVDYPPPPWALRGDAFVATRLVSSQAVRAFVPADLQVVSIVPGKTLAMVALIRYGAGSTLQYHELIVVPALVRVGWRIGAWISHIYVDNESSLHAGRAVWGLPKQLAHFDWRSTSVGVSANGVNLEMRAGASTTLAARVPLLGPIFGGEAQQLTWSIANGSGTLSRIRGALELTGNGLEGLGFDRVRRLYRIANFHLTMSAPRARIVSSAARS